ncbi:MAG: Spo0B domain-containing protein [Firmicutes bacterium]|nr:Spo0B domain-containing protein [Bacillota bacterium]
MGLQAEQMADLLRRIRHDYANHLQVVSGYLEIGQAEKARQYLAVVIGDMGAERIVFATHSGAATLYFYAQILKVRDLGITLHYEDIDIDGWKILQTADEPYNSMVTLKQTMPGENEDQTVYLSIHEDQTGIDMFFSWAGWDQNPPGIRIDKE